MKTKKLLDFFYEVKAESQRVSWPTLSDTLTTAAMVLVVVLLASLFLLIVDGLVYRTVRYLLMEV